MEIFLAGKVVGESVHALDESAASLGVSLLLIHTLIAFECGMNVQKDSAKTLGSDFGTFIALTSGCVC